MNFFGKVFNGLGHAIAWVFSKALPAAGKAAQEVETAVDSPLGTLIAGAFGPDGELVKAEIEAIAGSVIAARNDLGAAFNAKAADLGLDEKALQSVESLYGRLADLIHGKPPAPVAAE